ncbi:MAG: hypothetical protein GF401_12360 [Chitinivibrionales bacterium]|nr:hypothetical protein [Chitinivibrionales bacterium]
MQRFFRTLIFFFFTFQPSLFALSFYVSPTGLDTNPGTEAQPFRSLHKAAEAVALSGKTEAISVIIREGTYYLDSTLTFTPEHSGTADAKVVFSSFPGENVIIHGGATITGWHKVTIDPPGTPAAAAGKLWEADIDTGWLFHSLIVEGIEQRRAMKPDHDIWKDFVGGQEEWPDLESWQSVSPIGQYIVLPSGYLSSPPANGCLEINVAPIDWKNDLSVLRNIDTSLNSAMRHSKNIITGFRSTGAPFRIENIISALDTPGEWCVDSGIGKVYYWPPDDTMNNKQVDAPRLYNLIRLQGEESTSQWVHHIEFEGITFAYADRMPADQWPDEWTKRNFENPDGALYLQGVEYCAVRNCRVIHTGANAIALDHHVQNVAIEGNELAWCGSGGVQMYGYGPGTKDEQKYNSVIRNHIHHVGLVYWHGCAVSLFQSGHNTISHNYMHDLPYCGVSIVGTSYETINRGPGTGAVDTYGNGEAMHHIRWNEIPGMLFTRGNVLPYLHSRSNIVEKNIVVDCMLKLADGGAYYTWSCGAYNEFKDNLTHYTTMPFDKRRAYAVYMDDNVDSTLLQSNISWAETHDVISIKHKGDNQWINHLDSTSRTPQYDSIQNIILQEVDAAGGWIGEITDRTLDASVSRFIGSTGPYATTVRVTSKKSNHIVIELIFSSKSKSPLEITLYDFLGRAIAAGKFNRINPGKQTLYLRRAGGFPGNAYICQIKTEKSNQHFRVINFE